MKLFFYVLSVVLSVQVVCSQPETTKNKPNIIFILADDLGYGDVGFNGQTKIKTPVLDRMAAEGIVFTRHYAGSTVCGPSRASLITGLHTGHSPVRGNPRWTRSGAPVDLSQTQNTVAKELKKAGYHTAVIGKWGLAENLDEGKPHHQGFDYFFGFNRHGPAHHYYPERLWENDSLIELTGNVMKDKVGKYSQDLFTDKALEYVEKHHDSPFFLYLAYTIPHYELTIPDEYKTYYQQQDWPMREMKMGHYRHDRNGHVTYASMVSRMDDDIGRLLAKLNELGVSENTLVVFTSDNGHEYDRVNDPFFDSNGPFRGRKRDLYEGGIRVPFVATWPGIIMPGTTSDHPSAFWDFLPTACDIANVTPSAPTDGISYLNALRGLRQKNHDYLYWEFNERKGPIQAIMKGDWKLLYFVGSHYELYHIEKDPAEEQNVYQEQHERAKELKELLARARSEHPEFPLVKLEKSKK
ncbi:arylsulfatase [Marinoscillum furvescens]|uniref:Arylsulfatase A-like enzyme n=1 Tax=Marinoscillum furvescens DSM 4134 TaxID=1122208 RepID=A0A3D9L504_MARFU|nr:arylsulfatase [Marinoscillum furvescens]REE00172.1 arylsulfatase A-like enzyme [Marinoscillum furvescens DSM 4134]